MCATFLHKNTKQLWPIIDRALNHLSQYYYTLLNLIIYRKNDSFYTAAFS